MVFAWRNAMSMCQLGYMELEEALHDLLRPRDLRGECKLVNCQSMKRGNRNITSVAKYATQEPPVYVRLWVIMGMAQNMVESPRVHCVQSVRL